MTYSSPSPFARPQEGLRVVPGGPTVYLPTQEEAEFYPRAAARVLGGIHASQEAAGKCGLYNLDWVRGKHFLLAGGTGHGLGGCIAVALLNRLAESGSLTVVSRDPSRSITYETGVLMQSRADESGFGNRFHWINYGLATEGKKFRNIVAALGEAGAERVIYINTVAAAHSGTLPGYPPVYVKDVDEKGLFLWQLLPLTEQAVQATRWTMGTLSAEFPHELEKAGIAVEATAFTDWRGSLDRISRDPGMPEYGRQGPYSTSLYLPKEIIHDATAAAYASGKIAMDVYLPVMNTRALSLIPGGILLLALFERLMRKEAVRRPDVPELALGMLDRIGRAIAGGERNPFPRLDSHELPFDLWFLEVLTRLNEDEQSEFYYKKWVGNAGAGLTRGVL